MGHRKRNQRGSWLIQFFYSYAGAPVNTEKAPILVANHVSFFDPFYLVVACLPSFVAKREVADIPVVGTVARALQCLLVDRRSVDSRKETLQMIKSRTVSNDVGEAQFPHLAIFPEGTTTNGNALVTFHLGAFVPGNLVYRDLECESFKHD